MAKNKTPEEMLQVACKEIKREIISKSMDARIRSGRTEAI